MKKFQEEKRISYSNKLKRHLSYSLGLCSPFHLKGITAFCLSNERRLLYSSSRDGTVRQWNIKDLKNIQGSSRLLFHTDWVNDIVLLEEYGVLLSCSNDTSFKIWNLCNNNNNNDNNNNNADDANPKLVSTIWKHTDYVKCLAYSPCTKMVASGGFDHKVYLWDVTTFQSIQHLGDATSISSSKEMSIFSNGFSKEIHECGSYSNEHSIYSLAMHMSMTFTGSTDRLIRAWDSRTNTKPIMLLNGHEDTIRCLQVSYDGAYLLSGSSDHLIKLWDMREQKCIETFSPHTDSVWTMTTSSSSFQGVYSGGRDKMVYYTDFATKKSTVVAEESEFVTSMSMDEDRSCLWVGTLASTFQCWNIKDPMDGVPLTVAEAIIQGSSAITQHSILNNMRHILTEDNSSPPRLCLWDVTNGSLLKQYPKDETFESVKKKCFELQYAPPWFRVTSKLGHLVIHLDQMTLFDSQVYAMENGFHCIASSSLDIVENIKINLGEQVLLALFKAWLPSSIERNNCTRSWETDDMEGSVIQEESKQQIEIQEFPKETQLYVTEVDTSCGVEKILFHSTLEDFNTLPLNGAINLPSWLDEYFPLWAIDCVFHDIIPPKLPFMITFYLVLPKPNPCNEPIVQKKYSVPYFLRIRDFIHRLITTEDWIDENLKLYRPVEVHRTVDINRIVEEENFKKDNRVKALPTTITPTPTSTELLGLNQQRQVNLYCKSQVIESSLSFGAVWKHIWENPNEPMILTTQMTCMQ